MTFDEIIRKLETNVLSRKLAVLEKALIIRSLQGDSYEIMAREMNYTKGYLKVVGSGLWNELSKQLGTNVVKKNIYAVLSERFLSEGFASETTAETTANTTLETTPETAPDVSFKTAKQTRSQPNISATHKQSVAAAQSEPSSTQPVPSQYLQLVGPIPLDSDFYIERPPIEALAYQEIQRPGCLLRLRAPRKYGKSSLILRILAKATDLGFITTVLDFQAADRQTLENLDQLLQWICVHIIQQQKLSVRLSEVWDSSLSSQLNFKTFLQTQVLSQTTAPVMLIFNETDYLFEHTEVASSFLALLRACYEQAQGNTYWGQLRLVMGHATHIYVPLQLNQSPFNVGVVLELPPFSAQQATALAQKYGLQALQPADISALMGLLGGHPYLLNRAFYTLSSQAVSFEQFMQTAPTPTGVYSSHLQRYLALLSNRPRLIAAIKTLLTSPAGAEINPITAHQLKGSGLVRLQGYQAQLSCDLYRIYFSKILTHLHSCSTASRTSTESGHQAQSKNF